MYERFYGLHERPFDLTPNPRYLFLTAKHREALSNIEYGIVGRKGITLLIGEAGTGKTTLIRAAIEAVRKPSTRCVYLSNPTLVRSEFYEFLAAGFGISEQAARSKARFLIELEESVMARQRAGGFTALIIDEAQSLPVDLMEEVRLLANLETATEKLLPVVIAGQPELADRLNDPSLRQLKQRVALRCDLGALTIQETAAYVAGRIRIAGGEVAQIFTRDAVVTIHERSRGIPRTISVICDNALVSGFAADLKPIGPSTIIEVCRDFHLLPEEPENAATSKPLGTLAARRDAGPSNGRPRASAVGESAKGSQERGTSEPVKERSSSSWPAGAAAEKPAARAESAASGPLFSHFTRKRRFSFF